MIGVFITDIQNKIQVDEILNIIQKENTNLKINYEFLREY